MTPVQRRKLMTFAIVAFNFGELLLAAVNFLEGESLGRVALINGSQLVMMNLIMFYYRRKLSTTSNPT
jgi:hypothetical protein